MNREVQQMNNRETNNPQLPPANHAVTMENRRKAIISGVSDVESFNEQEIVFAISSGLAILAGRELHITKLNLDDGQLIVEGVLLGLEYQEETAKSGWFSKFLK